MNPSSARGSNDVVDDECRVRQVNSNSPTPERDPVAEENSSNTDSSSDEEEPACKKRKPDPKVTVDPRIDALCNQVSLLTNIIMQHQYANSTVNTCEVVEQNDKTNAEFLTNPSTTTSKLLELGICKTDFDDKKFIKPADEHRLRLLADLQHFNSPTWQHVRYNKVLHDMTAQPGFCNLKINEELCCLNKSKDFLASTELVIAALTNGLLHQRELLQSGLQGIIDWAHKNPTELNTNNLFTKFSETFGESSPSYKISEQSLQIVCGKRAECIESRRHRLISEIPDKNIQAALSNIPPSVEYLFEKTKLASLIHSLGGPQFWLSQSQLYKKDKPSLKRKANDPTPSTSRYQPNQKPFSQENYKRQQSKPSYKNKNNNNKPSSFRNNNAKKK